MAIPQTPPIPVADTFAADAATTMRAVVQHGYGAPDAVLEFQEVGLPEVGGGEVSVRVRAASVNPADWRFMRGSPFVIRLTGYGIRRPKNPIPGIDLSGVVDRVGTGVTLLRPGDEVFGWCRGAYAERVCAAQDHFALKPANCTFEQAAAVPLAGITALQGLRDKGKLASGQKVLVIGASGGVGTFAVQIARAFGAEVTGVCSTRNVEMVRSIGADHVIDYTKEDFVGGVQRYDLIFQLAGTRSPSDCRRALTPRGTLVLSSGDGRMSGMGRMAAAMVSSPFVGQKLISWVSKQNNADLVTLAALIEASKVKPVIDKIYDLSETSAAVAHLEGGHTRGKVVITV